MLAPLPEDEELGGGGGGGGAFADVRRKLSTVSERRKSHLAASV